VGAAGEPLKSFGVLKLSGGGEIVSGERKITVRNLYSFIGKVEVDQQNNVGERVNNSRNGNEKGGRKSQYFFRNTFKKNKKRRRRKLW